jgi:predicted alpha/beta-hydrolase family hydrolase
MAEKSHKVSVPRASSITAIATAPDGDAGWTFIYAPGAGANVHDPFGVFICRELASRGVRAIRFQFPYQEAGKSGPDRPPVLEATWRAVIEKFRDGGKICVGGRSMGGRVGSMVVAAGENADAVALFAYPLHPPGKPDQRRIEHLPDIKARTLFCSGTRDAFASPDELKDAAALVKRSMVHMMEGADHGFAVKKSTGRTKQDVYDEALSALLKFLDVKANNEQPGTKD